MNKLYKNLCRTITVTNELGLHARPAAMIAKIATRARSDVWLCKNGDAVDACSIIDILSLACLKGANVTMRIENPEDTNILNEIISLFENDFGERE